MSLQFSDTTTKKGIVQVIERMTTTQSASSSSYPLYDKTVDINAALANYMILATQAAGRWQVDDTNQEDYPIIFGNVVSGQQDYSFTVDEQGNQILDIFKVRIKDSNGNWATLKQRDLQDTVDSKLNSTTTGIPTEYDVTANGIFLTDIPNYTLEDALEIYISRTPTYFVSTDTTKKPGIPDIFHEYLAIRPSYFYCLAKGLPQAQSYAITLYGRDGNGGMERAIKDYYSNRNRDEKRRLVPNRESTK